MAKRGYGIKEGTGLDEVHDALGIRAGDRQAGMTKRVTESTNETDTSVSRDGNRWTRFWEKQGGKVYRALHD